jgi:phenylpyruvate tautomerase PptA (4-oxalocrotonate tautomerase family)
MAQVKIYALASNLGMCKTKLSSVVHGCLVDALGLPEDKRFQRFFPLTADDFIFPEGRGSRYTILEIQLFAGRTVEAKNRLIRLLFERFEVELGYSVNDLEINLIETPRENWGIRGVPADELGLTYRVEV